MSKVGWSAAFVQFDKIKSRHALGLMVAQVRFVKQFGEAQTGRIAPPGLLHEAVEDFDFSFGRSSSVEEAPFQNFLIRTAGEYPRLHVRMGEMKKREAMSVELSS